MQAVRAIWQAMGWGLSASSSAVFFCDYLDSCVTDPQPYHASGFAPLPACWGWLLVGVLLGLVAREALVLGLLWARSATDKRRASDRRASEGRRPSPDSSPEASHRHK